MTRPITHVETNAQLRTLVRQAISEHGPGVNLNHLDVSGMKHFDNVFKELSFWLCHLIVLSFKMRSHAPSRFPAARGLSQELKPAPTPSSERDRKRPRPEERGARAYRSPGRAVGSVPLLRCQGIPPLGYDSGGRAALSVQGFAS